MIVRRPRIDYLSLVMVFLRRPNCASDLLIPCLNALSSIERSTNYACQAWSGDSGDDVNRMTVADPLSSLPFDIDQALDPTVTISCPARNPRRRKHDGVIEDTWSCTFDSFQINEGTRLPPSLSIHINLTLLTPDELHGMASFCRLVSTLNRHS